MSCTCLLLKSQLETVIYTHGREISVVKEKYTWTNKVSIIPYFDYRKELQDFIISTPIKRPCLELEEEKDGWIQPMTLQALLQLWQSWQTWCDLIKYPYKCVHKWVAILFDETKAVYFSVWTFPVMLIQAQWQFLSLGQSSGMWRNWAITTGAFLCVILWFYMKSMVGSHRNKQYKKKKKHISAENNQHENRSEINIQHIYQAPSVNQRLTHSLRSWPTQLCHADLVRSKSQDLVRSHLIKCAGVSFDIVVDILMMGETIQYFFKFVLRTVCICVCN